MDRGPRPVSVGRAGTVGGRGSPVCVGRAGDCALWKGLVL